MTDAAPTALPTGPPVFGVNPETPEQRRRRSFGIEVETQVPATRGVPPHVERQVHHFDAYFDLDAGALHGLMNARTEMQQANAVAVLLGTTLDDLDGVPVEWVPPAQPEYDDEGEVLRADPTPEHPEGEPLYLRWDGELATSTELRVDPLADGSSRRRFQYLMDSPRHRVRVEALTEVSRWLTEQVSGHPTKRPSPSGHGPQPTGRGSRARSR